MWGPIRVLVGWAGWDGDGGCPWGLPRATYLCPPRAALAAGTTRSRRHHRRAGALARAATRAREGTLPQRLLARGSRRLPSLGGDAHGGIGGDLGGRSTRNELHERTDTAPSRTRGARAPTPYTRRCRARVEAWQGGCCQGHGASEPGGVGGGASRARGGAAGGAAVRSRDSCWHLRSVPMLGTRRLFPRSSPRGGLRERIWRPPRRGASCWSAAPPNKSTTRRAYGLPTIHGASRRCVAAAEAERPATHPRRQTRMGGHAPPVSTQLLHRFRSSGPPPSKSGSHPSRRRETPNLLLMRAVGRPSHGRHGGGKRTAHGGSAPAQGGWGMVRFVSAMTGAEGDDSQGGCWGGDRVCVRAIGCMRE